MLLDTDGLIKSDKPHPSLELVDPEMESYRAVRTLLNIVYRADPGLSCSLDRLSRAYELAIKWDCQSAMQVMRLTLRSRIVDKRMRLTLKTWIGDKREATTCFIDFFRLAAFMKDIGSATLAIQYGSEDTWDSGECDLTDELEGADVGNPSAWSWAFYSSVPTQYLWAYSRAWEEERVESKGKIDYDKVSKRFLVIMAVVEGKSA
jgi:hypothetical protein